VATPLEISTQPGADGIPVVTVAGEIDMSNAERFRDALGLAAASAASSAATAGGGGAGDGSFVVDLTGVDYLDSAGVHALFGHASRIRLIAGPLLEPVLTVSGLAGITSMRDDSPREPQ
jgi:anti-sigma B factor antagonist